MKKKKLFFFKLIIFLFISTLKSYASFEDCTEFKNKNLFFSQDHLKINFIEVDIKNYRKWTKNNLKILTSNSRYIDEKYKKRFNASITFTFEDNSKCTYKAKVRQSGDAKDHINYTNNSIIQSLDVSLEDGNIRGITKFKLFLPYARGNINDLIILGQISRELGFLAPRSIKVKSRINETESIMLFQEKAAKEMLEFNKRREGPILESDQKFFFDLVKNIPFDNKSHWSAGIPDLENKSIKTMLVKSTNGKLSERNLLQQQIYIKAIERLNYIYLYWANRFQDEKNNFYFFDYDLDNSLLSLFNSEQTKKLEMFNILLQATNSQHALSLSNRKFFWNGIENYFEPILYDTNVEIDRERPTTTSAEIRYPFSNFFFQAIDQLKYKLENIDTNSFYKEIILDGYDLDIASLKNKLNKIQINVEKINKIYSTHKNEELFKHNKYMILDNNNKRFNETLSEISPNTLLILYDTDKNIFSKCEIFFINCQNINLNDSQISKLIDGSLKINNLETVFFGTKPNISFEKNNLKKNILFLNKTEINFEEGIDVELFKEEKLINIYQKVIGSKIYFKNGILDGYTINYFGNNEKIKTNKNYLPPNYPINKNNLTGCLTFLDLEIKKIKLNASNSSCEDTINFINVNGNISQIEINNSFRDGLDADFSNINFQSINITNSGNDCIDVSAGNYFFEKTNIKDCGDKGVSIGEKALVNISNVLISKSNIGIASKDSSLTNIKNANIKNVDTCLAAYNKKLEFFGGYLKVNKLICDNYKIQFNKDQFSEIFFN